MFIWMTFAFTILFFPLMLVFGWPTRITTTGVFLTPALREKFPWSSKTPVVVLKPHAWFMAYMTKKGIAAYAFSGFIAFAMKRRSTEIHEAIHVTHQSVISPILYSLVYVLDWVVFLPFKSWFPENHLRRSPVAETVAYHVSHAEELAERSDRVEEALKD